MASTEDQAQLLQELARKGPLKWGRLAVNEAAALYLGCCPDFGACFIDMYCGISPFHTVSGWVSGRGHHCCAAWRPAGQAAAQRGRGQVQHRRATGAAGQAHDLHEQQRRGGRSAGEVLQGHSSEHIAMKCILPAEFGTPVLCALRWPERSTPPSLAAAVPQFQAVADTCRQL